MRILPRHQIAIFAMIAILIASLWFFHECRDETSKPKGSGELIATLSLAPRKASLDSDYLRWSPADDGGFSEAQRGFRRPEPVIAVPTSQVPAEYAPEVLVVDRAQAEPGSLIQLGIRAVNDADAQARERAVLQLCAAENGDVVPFLTASLRDSEPRIWRLSLEGLRRLGKRVPVGPVAEMAAHDPDPQRRAEILTLIRELAGPGADEVLEFHSSRRDRQPNGRRPVGGMAEEQVGNLTTKQR